MNILGISALYHDSAAALVIDGTIAAAAQEERFSRIKHDFSFPNQAIEYCLAEANLNRNDIDIVVFYDNPLLTLDRWMKNILASGNDSRDVIERSFDSMFSEKLWVHKQLEKTLGKNKKRKFLVCKHHLSHAASAFYPSPFEDAVIITLDGVGEWATTSIGVGHMENIELKKEIKFPHSLGLLYSAFTYFCGFKVNSGDYKFMGLAPYGEPIYYDLILKNIIDVKEDGSFRLNLQYFDFQNGRTMTNDKFAELFGGPAREPETEITKREMDIAASAQKVLEEIIIKIVGHAKKEYGEDIENLVMAGGVALNCVANGKIKNTGIFKNIWIQPAAGDAGGALGSALYAFYKYSDSKRKIDPADSQQGSYLGPDFKDTVIRSWLEDQKYPYRRYPQSELYTIIAENLAEGKVIGLFHGRMEFGPRALGNRSIIADARLEEMQVKLNLKIKYRESFRPFAPSVLYEDVSQYFELKEESPYMLLVENVRDDRRLEAAVQNDLQKYRGNMLEIVKKKRSDIPAVTHVDYSARIQTVTKEKNEYYYNILSEYKKKTGYSVIVNTSFNVRGEPIVCTPMDAYECFMRTEMDMLVLENCILYKEQQPAFHEKVDWKTLYELD